jgi:predicted transcriptional regulator
MSTMSGETHIEVGGGLENDLKAFAQAWRRAEAGDLTQERVLAFESWEALSKVLTGERYRLLRHVHAHPARSVNALAQDLRRQYRRVHEDVRILEAAGLIDRSHGDVRATTDRLRADVIL